MNVSQFAYTYILYYILTVDILTWSSRKRHHKQHALWTKSFVTCVQLNKSISQTYPNFLKISEMLVCYYFDEAEQFTKMITLSFSTWKIRTTKGVYVVIYTERTVLLPLIWIHVILNEGFC